MNARYEPIRRPTRFAAALVAMLTVVALFDTVAGLADTHSAAAREAGMTSVHMARAAAGSETILTQ